MTFQPTEITVGESIGYTITIIIGTEVSLLLAHHVEVLHFNKKPVVVIEAHINTKRNIPEAVCTRIKITPVRSTPEIRYDCKPELRVQIECASQEKKHKKPFHEQGMI